MSNYDAIKAMIAQFSGQENIIGVPRPFCKFMGSLEGGVFLSQIIFWSDKGSGEPGWFYKSASEWEEELMLSRYKVNKFSEQLEEIGVLETKLKRANGSPTRHFKLHLGKFAKRFSEFLKVELQGTSKSSKVELQGTSKFSKVELQGTSKFSKLELQETSKTITETTPETTTTETTTETTCPPSAGTPSDLKPQHSEDTADPSTRDEATSGDEEVDPRLMFETLAWLCEFTLDTITDKQRGQLNQTEKILREAGATPKELQGFRTWWYEEDWRGQQNQPPVPHQVREEWGRFKSEDKKQRRAYFG